MVRPRYKGGKQERTKEKKYLENYHIGLQKIMLFGTIQKPKLGPLGLWRVLELILKEFLDLKENFGGHLTKNIVGCITKVEVDG